MLSTELTEGRKIYGTKTIGRFEAVTFDGDVFKFKLNEDNTLSCDSFDLVRPIKKILLKPNMELRFENGQYLTSDSYARATKSKRFLIKEYRISENLLDYMVDEKIAKYSTDCAGLYDFKVEKAYDQKYQTRAFKHIKDKSKQMLKAKQGVFR